LHGRGPHRPAAGGWSAFAWSSARRSQVRPSPPAPTPTQAHPRRERVPEVVVAGLVGAGACRREAATMPLVGASARFAGLLAVMVGDGTTGGSVRATRGLGGAVGGSDDCSVDSTTDQGVRRGMVQRAGRPVRWQPDRRRGCPCGRVGCRPLGVRRRWVGSRAAAAAPGSEPSVWLLLGVVVSGIGVCAGIGPSPASGQPSLISPGPRVAPEVGSRGPFRGVDVCDVRSLLDRSVRRLVSIGTCH